MYHFYFTGKKDSDELESQTLAQKFQIEDLANVKSIKFQRNEIKKHIKDCDKYFSKDPQYRLCGLLAHRTHILENYYLLSKWKEFKKEYLIFKEELQEYLFGDWQKSMPAIWSETPQTVIPGYWRNNLVDWEKYLTPALAYGAADNDWEFFNMILTSVHEKSYVNNHEDFNEYTFPTDEARIFYRGLRAYTEGDLSNALSLWQETESGHRELYRLMARVMRGIIDKDQEAASCNWYFAFEYWRTECPWISPIVMQNSFLWHLAKKEGVDIPLDKNPDIYREHPEDPPLKPLAIKP